MELRRSRWAWVTAEEDYLATLTAGTRQPGARGPLHFQSVGTLPEKLLLATPRGYSPDIEIVTMAREMAEKNGSEIRLLQDPQAAVEGADAVYTDVCVSMGFEHESTKRAPIFRPFQVNETLMNKAQPNAVFMHCLPARRNAEVTDAVLDGPQSIVFDQAENRMHAQKALLLLLLGGLANVGAFNR